MADSVRTDTARTQDEPTVHRRAEYDGDAATIDHARGGFSLMAILTGVVVSLGAMFLLTAIIGGIGVATGLSEGVDATAVQVGWGVAIAVIVAQFLSYLWGGYTAGRMARGAGVLNGILVAIVALIFVAALGAILAAVTRTTPESAAADAQRLPLPLETMTDIGTGVGIGVLIAMLLGGALGGMLGQRWHTKLENGETRYTR